MVIFERFEDGLFNTDSGEISSLSTRFTLWDMGLERVKLAPFFGIALHRYIANDTDPLYFPLPIMNLLICGWILVLLACLHIVSLSFMLFGLILKIEQIV